MVPATQGAAAAVDGLIFKRKSFFLEKHIGSSFDVELSPGVMFEYCSVPLSKASQMGLEAPLLGIGKEREWWDSDSDWRIS